MNPVRSFVIRVYRQSARDFAGVVEDVRTGRSTPFHGFAELWAALLQPAAKRRKSRPVPPSEP
jgi:hypothetical protein